MLAPAFKTPAALGISDVEFESLVKVLGMLERGDIDNSHFDMKNFIRRDGCGTIGCICGWAHELSGRMAFPELVDVRTAAKTLAARLPRAMLELFGMAIASRGLRIRIAFLATPAAAAIALRSYLTSGEARWVDALAD